MTILIPAYNEEQVVAGCVRAARAVDYPELEVLVLDDGSRDGTADAAAVAAAGDERVEVVRDAVNRGKADRLNLGFARARHELVVVIDADTHLHPLAVKLLVARMSRSQRIAAVAGAPHVTNRENLLSAMQILEVASIIGLIRRTQALAGRVGVVAGVLGLFRRDAVLAVGGYRGPMATEDIDLSWRLLLDGWHTAYEPNALVGMQVPSKLSALWAQRRRWARGQGEVLHVHLRDVMRWRHRRLWPLVIEGLASLLWIVGFVVFGVLCVVAVFRADDVPVDRHRPFVGNRRLGRGDPAALLCAWARLSVRPPVCACIPARPALPAVLLVDFGGLGLPVRAARPVSRAGRGPGGLGHSPRSTQLGLSRYCVLSPTSHSCNWPPVMSRVICSRPSGCAWPGFAKMD